MTSKTFVLVLQLTNYEPTDLMTQDICGHTVSDWVASAVAPFAHRAVPATTEDDIITLFKNNLSDKPYTFVTYGDMPLLTTDAILRAVAYAEQKNAAAVKLPRGWVFNTQRVATSDDFPVDEFRTANENHYLVAFNNQQVAKIRALKQEAINAHHLKNGVNLLDPTHTYIDADVKIAAGVTIEPNVHLLGKTDIKAGATILDGCRITDSLIGENTQVGPYAHLRPHSVIGKNCRIGNYVEIKRSQIGDGTKIAHMTYVGDSTLGRNCNVGCGVIFCNYDGKVKTNCLVGDQVFIGSNSCMIAPLTIGDHAYIAAGSVITDQLPPRALGIARARQAIKEHYVTE